MCCGFDNCYSVSTIVENDIKYFEDQVRKGALAKFFEDQISLDNVLEGSTEETVSVEEFQFSRGHQKLITIIAKTVKDNLDKHGIDGFCPTEPSKFKKKISTCKLSDAPCKRQKNSLAKVMEDSNLWEPDVDPIFEDSGLYADEMATIHRNKLVKQAVASLKSVTPAMFKEVCTCDLKTTKFKKKIMIRIRKLSELQ